MPGEVVRASELKAPLTLDAQVCIVGSGAGGSILAMRLAQAGVRVVMLEAGPYCVKEQFTLREDEAFPLLYQDRGTRVTADGSITILQGRSVGGGTTINWTTCYRTPDRVLDHWRKQFGITALDSATLEPHFEAVEQRLNIAAWPEGAANANNRKLLEGARELGWQAAPTRRNVKGCVNSGYCGMGCPVDGKQAMHVTALPDAIKAGMILVAECPVLQVERDGDRVTGVVGRAQGAEEGRPQGMAVRVRAEVVVVSGGAINSPGLLLRSDINPAGRVGLRTYLHPVVGMIGRYKEPVEGFYGAPQSIASHQFAEPKAGQVGFFFETAPVHPMLAASAYPGFGLPMQGFIQELAHVGIMIALHVDGFLPGDEGGTVSLRPGGLPKLNYPVNGPLRQAMATSHKRLAELTFAAGADWVSTLHSNPLKMMNSSDINRLDEQNYGAFQHAIFSAHQMGGCAMGADPNDAVVDQRCQVRGMKNLFVVDGSVLPTSLGVNPSQTIYGMAHWAAEHVADSVGVKL